MTDAQDPSYESDSDRGGGGGEGGGECVGGEEGGAELREDTVTAGDRPGVTLLHVDKAVDGDTTHENPRLALPSSDAVHE